MSRFEVDTQAVDGAATTLRGTAEALRHTAHQIGRALEMAGSAGGSATLASSGASAGGQWRAAIEGYAEAGAALSRATEQAALAYRMVEVSNSAALTPVVVP